MSDASFEDGAEQPLRLAAETPKDLEVISALVQDSVTQVSQIAWAPKHRRFALLLNRFRWEDARRPGERRPVERVQSLLTFEGALAVRANGVDPRDRDLVLSILSIACDLTEDGSGLIRLTLAGDGEIAIAAECLDATLRDVTRPYAAPSGKAPSHPE
jgi:hypothetical protein